MSVPNQSFNDDHLIPLDLRYTDFLNALKDISNETMRDRCHQYWTSLYRYFDRSMTNEQALQLEEKRTQEILHRLNMEMISQESEIAYQVRNLLQRGHQVLADLHFKYNQKKESLTEIKQDITNLEKQIQTKKSQHSLASHLSMSSSSISLNHINDTINELKSEINNLYLIRETYQTELNNHNRNYFSTQIQAYHIQQTIHKVEIEFKEIQHELTSNLKENFERNKQLEQYKQNLDIFFHHEHFHFDRQLIHEQIRNEEKRMLELKNQTKEINYNYLSQMTLLKIQEHKQKELNIEDRNLIDNRNKIQDKIQKENEIHQKNSQILIDFKRKLKQKEQILSTQYRQAKTLKNQIHDLEHQRDVYLQHPIVSSSENLIESNETLKKTIEQQVNHRVKLTLLYHNRKSEQNELTNTINEYVIIVKNQRDKILHYEKLHDKWILNINSNKNHLMELFQRMNRIEQNLTKTNDFLEQFNQIKLSLRPKLLILYHKINLYIQQRREKNDMNISTITESKNSLTMKINQSKQILRSNQKLSDQIEQNLLLLKKNSSLISNQILTINKQHIHIKQYLHLLENKILIQDQDIVIVLNKFNRIQSSINLNHNKLQQLQFQKRNLISFLFRKQYLIRLLHKHILFNEKNLQKHQFSQEQLFKNYQQTKIDVVFQIKQIQTFNRHDSFDFKEELCHLRKQLLEYRKKTNDYQHRINRRHFTRQILTQINNKSIPNETHPEYRLNLQQKLSSIIYRLICKTHYNIILHQHIDLIMQKTLLLYSVYQQSLNKFSKISWNQSLDLKHLNNQLKSSIAELSLLKNEILLSKKLYLHMKLTLENTRQMQNKERNLRSIINEKTGTQLCVA